MPKSNNYWLVLPYPELHKACGLEVVWDEEVCLRSQKYFPLLISQFFNIIFFFCVLMLSVDLGVCVCVFLIYFCFCFFFFCYKLIICIHLYFCNYLPLLFLLIYTPLMCLLLVFHIFSVSLHTNRINK